MDFIFSSYYFKVTNDYYLMFAEALNLIFKITIVLFK
jgi:hypothetical protein